MRRSILALLLCALLPIGATVSGKFTAGGKFVAGTTASGGGGDGNAANGEARCDVLAGNCICAESLQATTFNHPGNPDFWDPTDSTSKECTEQVTDAPIVRAAQDLPSTSNNTDATMMARLPAGHSVTRVLTHPTTTQSNFYVGAGVSVRDSAFTKHAAFRGYVYHSPAYNFASEEPGCHSKFLEGFVGSWHIENATGHLAMYQFANGNWGGPNPLGPGFDCCTGEAPGTAISLTEADWKGRWIRVEAHVVNRAGGDSPDGVRHKVYLKDVTNPAAGLSPTQLNGGEEWVGADWTVESEPTLRPWEAWDDITSSPAQATLSFNLYRGFTDLPDTVTCNGFRGATYIMAAGWNTDAGERIGSALEVEGVAGDI
jgi:hypothetical protein